MSRRWEAVNVRAQGLRTHLLTRAQLASLADAPDLHGLATRLRALGFPVTDTAEPSVAELELAVRRRAAAALRILARWSRGRPEVMAVLFDEEDRRSIRALVRGAVERAPAEQRIAGLIPTPALPERALLELARAPTAAAVAALLVAWQHPFGPALAETARSAAPDLFRFELDLDRAVSARLSSTARRAGGFLATYAQETVDTANALTAVALAGAARDVKLRDAMLRGGRALTIEIFLRAVASGSGTLAARTIANALGAGLLATALRTRADTPAGLEDAVLAARIAALRDVARRDPLGPAPLIGFGLALRAQTTDLHRVIWGVALGAPPPVVAGELVTAA